MSNKIGLRQAAVLLTGLLAAGCTHKDTIVGKWQGTNTSPQGAVANATYEFTQDGKENMTAHASQGLLSINIACSGNYTVNGNTLTQNFTSITVGTATIPVPADKVKPQTDPFTLNGNTLMITDPTNKRTVTLTRVKS